MINIKNAISYLTIHKQSWEMKSRGLQQQGNNEKGDICKTIAYQMGQVLSMLEKHLAIESERWKWEYLEELTEDGYKTYRCSCCGSHQVIDDWYENISTYKYCPNCGADMRGKDNG